jgi:tubulin-folding cofactor B
MTIGQLANKLELLCGVSADAMQLAFYADGDLVKQLAASDLAVTLESLLPSSWERLRLDVKDPQGQLNLLQGGDVEKFELTDEAYEKRQESLRNFKIQNKLGRFDEETEKQKEMERQEKERIDKEKSDQIKVGNRCDVRVTGQPSRRGLVMFVGEAQFKPGVWVGVRYDEPLGKNDGSVAGQRYFQCPPKYGGFVKPSDVEVGDYPEENFDLDEF